MVWILIVFAVEQLRDVVEADEYYSEDFLYQDITELGSISNAIEIHDVCLYDDAYYRVGGGVRLNEITKLDRNFRRQWFKILEPTTYVLNAGMNDRKFV